MYLELVFRVIFLYFFNLHFPITELGAPSFALSPPGHLSLRALRVDNQMFYQRLIHISPGSRFWGGFAASQGPGVLGSCLAVRGTVWWQLLSQR